MSSLASQSVAAASVTCWQCGAEAQRVKNGIGACFRHCLPSRKERRAMAQPPVQPERPKLVVLPQPEPKHQPKPKATRAPKPASANKDGIVERHSVVCAGDMRPTCQHDPREHARVCQRKGAEPNPETGHVMVRACADHGEHNKIITYYGGNLPLKRTGPSTAHIQLPPSALPAAFLNKYLPYK